MFMADKCDINKVDRSKARLVTNKELSDKWSDYSPAQLVGLVWDLTVEAYSLKGDFDAQQRLQRNVTKLIKKSEH